MGHGSHRRQPGLRPAGLRLRLHPRPVCDGERLFFGPAIGFFHHGAAVLVAGVAIVRPHPGSVSRRPAVTTLVLGLLGLTAAFVFATFWVAIASNGGACAGFLRPGPPRFSQARAPGATLYGQPFASWLKSVIFQVSGLQEPLVRIIRWQARRVPRVMLFALRHAFEGLFPSQIQNEPVAGIDVPPSLSKSNLLLPPPPSGRGTWVKVQVPEVVSCSQPPQPPQPDKAAASTAAAAPTLINPVGALARRELMLGR